jgi:ABC-type antimicrobial peptide transport system permease subunit
MHTEDIYRHFAAFRADLLRTGAVSEVAESVSPVTASWPFNGDLTWTGHHPAQPGDPDFAMKGISTGYAPTVGLQFIAGRDFRTDTLGADARNILLNESAAGYMGFKDPVGKTVTWMGEPYTVVGVVRNTVMESPYEKPIPAIYYLADYTMSYVTIRLHPNLSAREALDRIKREFDRYNPAEPFDFRFVDQQYEDKFQVEQRVGALSGFLTGLAIFISCLGLFGLATFVAEQRTREIGIRKVLGATVFGLWQMQSRDFVLLTALSCGIAIPIAWWFLYDWLQQFPYRMALSWWIFGLAGLGAFVITLATVSFQAVRAARANPVRSLRAE